MTSVKSYLYRQRIKFRGASVVRSVVIKQLLDEGFELKIRDTDDGEAKNMTSPNMRYRPTLYDLVKGEEVHQLSPRSATFVLHLLGKL